MFEQLPVDKPDQLLNLTSLRPNGQINDSFSYPTFTLMREHNQVFSGMFASKRFVTNMIVDRTGEIVIGSMVSGDYFSVLGVSPSIGRLITPADDQVAGCSPVAVISYGYWQKRFHGDSSVVGQKIALNDFPFVIIGVTKPEFVGLTPGSVDDVEVPVSMIGQIQPALAMAGTPHWILAAPDRWQFSLVARKKAGLMDEAVLAGATETFQEAMLQAANFLSIQTPAERDRFLKTKLQLLPGGQGQTDLRDQFSKPLLTLMSMVGLLLLIACANLAHLMLARSSARQKETAIRIAMGAKRSRMVRQLLTEILLFALLGGVCGLFLALIGDRLLITIMSNSSAPIALHVKPNGTVLGFTALICLLSTFLFGLVPALDSVKLKLFPMLKDNKGSSASLGRFSIGRLLVVSQVALSMVLLIGAGLLIHSLSKLKNVNPGFREDHILMAATNPGLVGYKGTQIHQLYENILSRLNAVPGIQRASCSLDGLLRGNSSTTPAFIQGYNEVKVNYAGPDYFTTLGIPVQQGREFTMVDKEGAPKVAIITKSMATHFSVQKTPSDGRFGLSGAGSSDTLEIIGVVGDSQEQDLHQPASPRAYLPIFQSDMSGLTINFEVRTAVDPVSVAASMERVIHDVDSRLPIFRVKTLERQVADSLIRECSLAVLSGFFGIVGLVLASIGLYGVMAYAVTRRTSEIGIRMAIGAQRASVMTMILRETLLLVAIGFIVGIPVALIASRLIANQLYGMSVFDPLTIGLCMVVMAIIAVLAGYVPAQRAARVDPMTALRHE